MRLESWALNRGPGNPEPANPAPLTMASISPNRPCHCRAHFLERRLKRFLERHHQLDPIERAQTQLLERGRRFRPRGPARSVRRSRRRSSRLGCARVVAPCSPDAQRWMLAPLELLRALRARQRRAPARSTCSRRAGDPRAARSRRARRCRRPCRREHEHRVDALLAVDVAGRRRPRPSRRAARSERALDVLRKDVQSLRRDDHFLLAALDQQASRRVQRRRCLRCGTSRRRMTMLPRRCRASRLGT